VHYYEIFINKDSNSCEDWDKTLKEIQNLIGTYRRFKIIIDLSFNIVKYYLKVSGSMPLSLKNSNILLKKSTELIKLNAKFHGIYFNSCSDNILSIFNKLKIKEKVLKQIILNVFNYEKMNSIKYSISIFYEYNNLMYKKKLFFSIPSNILAIDFSNNKSFMYKEVPKFFKIDKIAHLLNNSKTNALFKIDSFPYLADNFYLKTNSYDFNKHSLVIGSSGTGKSKFLALLVNNIHNISKDHYKVVIIDPHDSLKDDFSINSKKIINFIDKKASLFDSKKGEINARVESMLSLFSGLIDNYNGKVTRVLRYAIYILLWKGNFNFINLRKLLLDLEYRNMLINELKREIPAAVSYFFLTDFNDIRATSYNEAIAPIIAFIDEMQMVPVFSEETQNESITDVIKNNFLSIFSLNRLKLGDSVTKTIAGIILEQLFLLAMEGTLKEEMIIIIDEVAVIENPILERMLAEARKFRVAIILAGQYFNQISHNLQEAILANTSNYYIFRVSNLDANILNKNLQIKLANSEKEEDKINLMTNLNRQECLVGISKNGITYPIFKAKTLDFIKPKPAKTNIFQETKKEEIINKKFNFKIDSNITVNDIMKSNSASRKEVL